MPVANNKRRNGSDTPTSIDTDLLATQIRDIYKKELNHLPVSKDLPRLARKVRIYNENNEVVNYIEEREDCDIDLNNNTEDPVLARIVYSLLSSLSEQISDSRQLISLHMFDREINVCDPTSIYQFLVENFGYDGRTIRLLKACTNQSILAPVVTQMKKTLMNSINYKDAKSGWGVNVMCSRVPYYKETDVNVAQIRNHFAQRYGVSVEARTDCKLLRVRVVHKKTEQVLTKEKGKPDQNLYQFEWQYTLTFNEIHQTSKDPIALELSEIEVKLNGINWNNEHHVSAEDKKNAEILLCTLLPDISVQYDSEFENRIHSTKQKRK